MNTPSLPNRHPSPTPLRRSGIDSLRLTVISSLLMAATSFADRATESIREFFPFGIWYQGCLTDKGMYEATMADDIKALGINFVIANADTNLPPDSPEPRSLSSMLNLADKLGLKVLVGLAPLVKTEILADIKTPAEFDAKRAELKAKLAPFVEEAKKHPSLFAWWCGDEPSARGLEVIKVAEKLRQLFVELDAERPSFCEGVWSVVDRDVTPWIANIKEPVFMPEVYPFWNSPFRVGVGDFRSSGFKPPTVAPGGKPVANVAGLPGFQQGAAAAEAAKAKDGEWINVDIVDQYRQVRPMIGDRAFWPWLQIFREKIQPGWDWRIPTVAEARCQAWIALAEGCHGLAWFGYEYLRNSGDHVQMFPEVKSIIASVDPITDVLLDCKVSENIATAVGGGSRYYTNALVETLRDGRGTPYLVVVNRNCEETGNSRVSVKALLPKPKSGARWLAVDPASNAVMAAGADTGISLELDLRPGEGRMVRLVEESQGKPVISPDIATVKVGETIAFKSAGGIGGGSSPRASVADSGIKASGGAVSGGVVSGGPSFERWSVVGFPAGTIDAKSGLFKALKPGQCTVWCRDAGGNSGFTRDIRVE